MAQKVNIVLIDDLDNESDASETVSFGLDGTTYEIDLTDANAAKLRDSLALYVGSARKVTSSRRGRTAAAKSAPAGGPSAREVRDWARSNGFDVPDRGRIPADVREAFDAKS